MNRTSLPILLVLAAVCCPVALAQAPAGSSGQCKDGTYSSAPKRDGACRGHKGIQTWYLAAATPAAASATPAPTVASRTAPSAPAAAPIPPAPTAASRTTPAPPAAAPASSARVSPSAQAASRTQASGGGPGLVWVNTPTKVYHCSGSDFYGKTKEGKYMSEADAKAMGAHADHNKACSN